MPVRNQPLAPGQIIHQHQDHAPVDVKAIAHDLGVNVWEMRELPSGIAGKIFRDPLNGGRSGYSIAVGASAGYLRQRFTVAHELAHFILHRDRIGNALSDDAMYQSGLPTREEAEANRLAAEILMPAHLLVKLRSGGDDVNQLASKFGVSEAVMRIRLSYFL